MSFNKRKRKKRIKEIYYYKVESSYKIDLLDVDYHLIKLEKSNFFTKNEVNAYIDSILDSKNKKYEMSLNGIKIYNKKPIERLLIESSSNLFDSYVKKLISLKEDNFSKKISTLLRSVADLIDTEKNINMNSDELETGVKPDKAVDSTVPFSLIQRIQTTLNTTVNLNNLTFMFQGQKWHLTKDGFEQKNLPEPRRPKTSHVILSGIQHMINLLGINSEVNSKIGENSFRFVDNGDVYVINHVYTGDHNTIKREI